MGKQGFQLQIIVGEKKQTRDFPNARALLDFVFVGGDRGVLRDEGDNHIGWRDSAVFSRLRPAELVLPEAHLLPMLDGEPVTPEELHRLAGPKEGL